MSLYKHLVWDWNGTLLDDAWTCVTVLNEILASHSIPPTSYEYYLRNFDFPIMSFYEGLGFDFSQEDYNQIADDYIALYRQQQLTCQLQPGSKSVLSVLAQQGFGQSILSAYHTDLLVQIVAHFGIDSYFTHIQGLDNFLAAGKIDQGRVLLKQLNLPHNQILLVGDTTHDHEVAIELGIDCVLIKNGHQHVDRLLDRGVEVLDSLPALLAYLA